MDTFTELAQLALGDGAHDLISKFSEGDKDRRQRAATAGLSAIGAGAGAYGLGLGAREIHRNAQKAKITDKVKGLKALRYGLQDTPKRTKALIPIELAGLGGEIMSTKILGHDAKRKKTTLAKMDPSPSDVHVMGTGQLKRLAAKKAYEKAAPKAKKQMISTAKELNPVSKMTWEGEISKVDTDRRQVFGWASIVEVNGEPFVDLQGDMIDHDELEKSAYEYVIKSRKGGDMHRRDGDAPFHASDMIESFIVTPEKKEKLGLPDSMPTGWWVGYQINDPEAWELVKSGKRTAFSIHGRGQRTPVEL